MPPMNEPFLLEDAWLLAKTRIESRLSEALNGRSSSPRLSQAMRYACLSGGKRIRPILIYATADALQADRALVDSSAAAIELIHCYSLVHDDLPAMDNDHLRRGIPTCHIEFDEATAILVGDALQSLAYEMLASDPANQLSAESRIRLIQCLAKASGTLGMAAGQMLDLEATDHRGDHLGLRHLENIHQLKTGALIRASVEMASIACGLEQQEHREALLKFADLIGLAFQVRDDVLDVIGDTDQLGKHAGADTELNKLTYPNLLGLEAAKEKTHDLINQAIVALTPLKQHAIFLKRIAEFVVERIY